MKKIRIKLNPIDISNLNDAEHFATSYIISRSRDFSDPKNIILENIRDTSNITELIADVDIEEEETAYVKVQLHFINKITKLESSSGWGRIAAVNKKNSKLNISNLILKTPLVESTPHLDGTIDVETSTQLFYTGESVHTSTTWEITDSSNYPVYLRSEDKDNLLRIRTQSFSLEKGKAYVFKAKHISNSNESTYGKKLYLDKTSRLQICEFTLKSKFINNNRIYYKVNFFIPNIESYDLEIKDSFSNSIFKSEGLISTNGFIKINNIEPGNLYNFYINVRFDNNTEPFFRWVYSAIGEEINLKWLYGSGNSTYNSNGAMIANDVSFQNLTTIFDREKTAKHIRTGNGVVSSYQMEDGGIILPEFTNNHLALYRFDGESLFKFKRAGTLVDEGDMAIDYVNILPLPSPQGDIIINFCYINQNDNSKKSVWAKYEFHKDKNELKKVSSFEAENEYLSTSVSTSAVISDDGSIYYIPAREFSADKKITNLSIYKLDTINMVSEPYFKLPIEYKYNITMVRSIDGLVYLFGGSQNIFTDTDTKEDIWFRENNFVYEFDIEKKSLNRLDLIYPEIWPNNIYSMQGYLRHDHNIVLFNSVHNGDSLGNQNVLVFNTKTKNFSIEETGVPFNIPFRNNIALNNGSIIRISSKVIDPQKVYIYIANGLYNPTKNKSLTENENDLVVPEFTLGEIEDPYRFDSIEIKENGILKWISQNSVKSFTSGDRLVTRNMVEEVEKFNVKDYENIIILDGKEYTFSGVPEPYQPEEKNLIVNNGKIVKVTYPNSYSSITIEGDGKLIWEKSNLDFWLDNVIYTENDLLVTSNTIILEEDYYAKKYSNIIIFGESSLTIAEKDPPLQPKVYDLVVTSGKRIRVSDPYYYNSITIENNGKLSWEKPDGVTEEFDDSYLLVTRDKIISNREFLNSGKSNIFKFDNSELIFMEDVIEGYYKTIKFYSNGGSGFMDTIDAPLGEYIIPENLFIPPDGKQFKHWGTDSSGVTNYKIPGETIEFGTKGIYNLYAIWEYIEEVPPPNKPNIPVPVDNIVPEVLENSTHYFDFTIDENSKLDVSISQGEGSISIDDRNRLVYISPTIPNNIFVTLNVRAFVTHTDTSGLLKEVYSDALEFKINIIKRTERNNVV